MKSIVSGLILAVLVQGCMSGSPLHQAVAKNDPAALARLLDQGAKIDERDTRGCTPLYRAVEAGNKALVEQLLARGAKPSLDAFLKSGNTPLHAAAQKGRDEIIELLLAKGAKINTPNRIGQTPLMLAAWGRFPETTDFLLARGADVSRADRYGWTVLHAPWRAAPPDEAYRKIMETLISTTNAPINACTRVPGGYTPLMSACALGDRQTVELLLRAGAKVNLYDQNGQTAYAIADQIHSQEIKTLLLEWGALKHLKIEW